MFSTARMMRLRLLLLEQDERAVLVELGILGVVELTRTATDIEGGTLIPCERGAEVRRCEQLLGRVEALRQSLSIGAETANGLDGAVAPGERSGAVGNRAQHETAAAALVLTLLEAEEQLRVIENGARQVVERDKLLVQQTSDLTATGDRLSGYPELDLPLDRFEHFSFLHFVTGSVPEEQFPRLLTEATENVALLPLAISHGKQRLVAMCTRRGGAALDRVLSKAGFEWEKLPAEPITATELSERIKDDRAAVAQQLEELTTARTVLAREARPKLAAIERAASLQKSLCEAEQNFGRTKAAILVTGWVPAEAAPGLKERLDLITDHRCKLELTAPDNPADGRIPVLLRHSPLLRPFELLVAAYGLPAYGELEPTIFVAISYVLMFGIMFGDVGHGAVLALVGLTARMQGGNGKLRDLGLVLFCAGLSSMVFGALYGSYFGLTQFKELALWHDPLEGNPMRLMLGAISFWIVLISVGLLLNIINRWRRGDVLGAILDKFGAAGLLFYWGLLALTTQYAVFKSWGLVTLAWVLFLGLPVLAWMMHGPVEYVLSRRNGHLPESGAGLGTAFTESAVGAFEAVLSYFANTISFVRLAAYAMSHAALLLAAFLLAAEVNHLSGAGGVLSVLVIIAGNGVAIVLEGIIASVQALRLEYYEFFGKFFSCGGSPFKPFRFDPVIGGKL